MTFINAINYPSFRYNAPLIAPALKNPSQIGNPMTAWTGTPDGPSAASVNATGSGFAASQLAAVTGTFSATGQSASFAPLPGRDFNIYLGAGTCTVQLECCPPDSSTWHIITAAGTQLEKWTNPAAAFMEQWACSEAGARFRLNCTAYTSGTPAYRISQ